jgi:hypothetical protein
MLALRSRPAGVISNRPLLHWLKTVVVSDVGKGAQDASGRDRGRRSAAPVVGWGSLLTRRYGLRDIRTGHYFSARDKPGGCPLIGQAVSGVEAT